MSTPRATHATQIADQLNELAAMVKIRSRVGLTDASHLLETITARFLNALFGWDLKNLNVLQPNYPAADLGDHQRRIAIQITNEDGSDKIKQTAAKAIQHRLSADFDRLIIFFLLPRKPAFPKGFIHPARGPTIETWDIADLLRQLLNLSDLGALLAAASVLDEEMGRIGARNTKPKFDLSLILKYAPSDLIGRESEIQLLNEAWEGRAGLQFSPSASQPVPAKPKILTFVALGGEGKTSLVAKWAVELAHKGWLGCAAAFAWSFYSQGTRGQLAASSDLFLKEALTFFGDKETAESNKGAHEKGKILASLVGQRRSLLILDGLEPLQWAPTAPTPGALKDQGIAALLKGLAADSRGLCVITTRYSLPDLKVFRQTAALEINLQRLSRDAGVHLLKSFEVRGSDRKSISLNTGGEMLNEFDKLVEDVKGHALTLTLLGGFLKRAFHGDIRQRDRVKFKKADDKMDGGHAFRTIAAYEHWLLSDGGEQGRREVAVLRLMGLFDRPADIGSVAALRNELIPGLTEPVAGLTDDDWEFCLSGLEAAKLLTVSRDAVGAVVTLDTHPHLREYFGKQLRERSHASWRAANLRLYEHLCAITKEGDHPTLEALQPLCQAVAHGCSAELLEEACEQVYSKRLLRGSEAYIVHQLGAVGTTLGVLISFFETPWTTVLKHLPTFWQNEILNDTAYCLRASGRLAESAQAIGPCVDRCIASGSFHQAAISGNNLADLWVMLGELPKAYQESERAVDMAVKSGDAFQQSVNLATLGSVLHQQGKLAEALNAFIEAENTRRIHSPNTPLIKSVRGFQYCDALLAKSETSAWRFFVNSRYRVRAVPSKNTEVGASLGRCTEVEERSNEILEKMDSETWPIDTALEHLTLGRAALYRKILKTRKIFINANDVGAHVAQPVWGLRRAGDVTHLPYGLLTRAWFRFLSGAHTGPDSAHEDLEEAWEIAERGPMRLFLVDIHLYRARLFAPGVPGLGFEENYPWKSPAADLAAAEKLINNCGYHRRDQELDDARRILGL